VAVAYWTRTVIDEAEMRPSLTSRSQTVETWVQVSVCRAAAELTQGQAMGAAILSSLADRDYGLRDCTVLDPDGFGIRFGTERPRHWDWSESAP
jgi:hypothetical protein